MMPGQLTRREVLVGTAASAAVLTPQSLAAETGEVHEILIKAFRFEPAQIQVRIGDKVRWTNQDLAPHTATADEYGWDTGMLAQTDVGEVTITRDMEVSYFCAFHPHMKGSFEIV